MDARFVLRRADISDIDALSQLRQKTFRETFVEDFSIPFPENTHYGFSKVGEFDYSVGELKNCEFIMKRETNTDSVFLIKIKTKNPFLDDN